MIDKINKDGLSKLKKGQVTIFIILALILVVLIAFIFAFSRRGEVTLNKVANPQDFIESCVQSSLEKNEQLILENNGYENVSDNYMLYRSEKVPFLCVSSQFYVPCVNQEPMLIEKIRRTIEDKVKPDAEKCFSDLIGDLRRDGFSVNEDPINFVIELKEGVILANIDKKIVLTKLEETRVIELWRTQVNSPLFSLVDTERNIVNYESTLCEFNSISWMDSFPLISIERFVSSDGSKVYTLTDKSSNKELKFAVRTCVLPAGI